MKVYVQIDGTAKALDKRHRPRLRFKGNVEAWRISLTTFAVLVLMVVLINFIGEALLQAFDPRRRGGVS